jgi:hypothetical protein
MKMLPNPFSLLFLFMQRREKKKIDTYISNLNVIEGKVGKRQYFKQGKQLSIAKEEYTKVPISQFLGEDND